MFITASTRCFFDLDFGEACQQITELGFHKIELSLHEERGQLKPSEIAEDPELFVTQQREWTRLTPVAITLEHDVDGPTFSGLAKVAKLLRITQITVPASPLGTPFNTEIDRLNELVSLASREGICVSLKTTSGHLTEDPRTAVELCQSVEGLGLTLDPSYYLGSEPYDQVFAYVYHVHLRDSTPEDLQVRIGLGDIDYSRLINQLRRHGYGRALSVDLLPEWTDPEARPLEMRKLRMLLETLL